MSGSNNFAGQLRRIFSTHRTVERDVLYRLGNRTRGTEIAAKVEAADSGAKRSRGLLGRTGLLPGEGIWIVPCEAVHTFAMKFAIDLIYLDRQHRIRKIQTNVRPWRISICMTAHSVVELPSGFVQRQIAQVGDYVEFSPIDSTVIRQNK